MMAIGRRVDETGTLLRDGGAFYLRRDAGGRYQLELQRTPVDLDSHSTGTFSVGVANLVSNRGLPCQRSPK